MAKRAKIGDVIEFTIGDDYHYGQITHKTPRVGYLFAVFEGGYAESQSNLEVICESDIQFQTFYFIQAALKTNLAKIVGNFSIRADLKEFPVFKKMNIPELSGEIV